jgi:hypothetical protein
MLVRLAAMSADGSARHRTPLAPQSFRLALDQEIAPPFRKARSCGEHSGSNSAHEPSQPLVGCTRIHGELLKLGIAVAQSTVARYLPRSRKPPSQTWRTFLTNHLAQTAAIDFFTVPTATFRVLFVFVVLSHERRRVVHFGVTKHPTQEWTMQQMREAFPWDQAPRFVLLRKRLRHHDPRYGNGRSAYCTAIPLAKGLCFTLHLLSTLRNDPTGGPSLGQFDALGFSWRVVARMLI